MRKCSLVLSLFLLAGIVLFTGCEEEKKKEFKLLSLMTDGGLDLAGATQVTDVPEDALIIATFSSNVDPATVSTTTFKITNTDEVTLQDYSLTTVGPVVTATPSEGWDGGSQFSIEISTTIEGTNGVAFSGNTLGFRTSGIFVPQEENQVLFLSFDDQSTVDEAGSHTVNTIGTLLFANDRWGAASSAAYFSGDGNLVEVDYATDLISPSITISFWLKTDLADYNGGAGTGLPQTRFVMGLSAELGYFLEMGRRSNDPQADGYQELFLKFGTDHVNAGDNAASVPKATDWCEVNGQITENYVAGTTSGWSYVLPSLQQDPPRTYLANLISGNWVHIVLTHDATAQTKTLYINGVKVISRTWIPSGADYLFTDLSWKDLDNAGEPWATTIDGNLALGNACSQANKTTGWCDYETLLANPAESKKFFKGAIDQFRIFSVPLSATEVATLYNSEN